MFCLLLLGHFLAWWDLDREFSPAICLCFGAKHICVGHEEVQALSELQGVWVQ